MKLVERHGRRVYLTCLVGLVMALMIALPTYIHSSFLEQYMSEHLASGMFMIAGAVTVALLMGFNRMLRKFGNTRMTLLTVIIGAAGALAMVYGQDTLSISIGFIAFYAACSTAILCIDIFLEAESDFRDIGTVRGLYLTGTNMAWVVSPLVAGSILEQGTFQDVYKTSVFMAGLVVIMVAYLFRRFKDPHYRKMTLETTWHAITTHDDLRKIFVVNMGLHLFYIWMMIYTPIYLTQTIGFSWSQFGLLSTIALLPFVIFELPLGRLADRKLTEHTYLGLGFTIMAISTGVIALLFTNNFLIWALVLFMTRVGASISEVMIETYFFRHIHSDEAGILSIFRTTRQLPLILGPLIFTAMHNYIPMQFGFIVLALILFAIIFVIHRLPPTIIHRYNHKPHLRDEVPRPSHVTRHH